MSFHLQFFLDVLYIRGNSWSLVHEYVQRGFVEDHFHQFLALVLKFDVQVVAFDKEQVHAHFERQFLSYLLNCSLIVIDFPLERLGREWWGFNQCFNSGLFLQNE
jgi:hypothetical protein